MKDLQHYLDLLLNKYQAGKKAVINADALTVSFDGKTFPLLPHRRERRFTEMKSLMNDGSVRDVCTYRASNISPSDGADTLARELDLCEFILGEEIIEVYALSAGGKALNLSLLTSSGTVCSIELSRVLQSGQRTVDKHEVIAGKGIVCDMVVDTQVPQSSVYVLGKENKNYLDVDFELFGLEAGEAAAVRQAFDAVRSEREAEILKKAAKRAEKLAAAVNESVLSGENVIIGREEV